MVDAASGRAEPAAARGQVPRPAGSPKARRERSKPRTAASARRLNDTIHEVLREEQIFRIDHFLGKEAALNILAFSKKAMAVDVKKVLASAIANAENNHNLDVDSLVVAEASVGKSISMKRFATRARGRSTRIVKPFSRLRVVVREVEEKDA